MIRKIIKKIYLKRLIKHGLNVGKNLQLEKGANIDSVFPQLITIGDNVTLAKDTYILSHDGATKKIVGYTKVEKVNIGNNVFIGTKSVIMPGVEIGENSIIGALSLVNKNIPSNEVWGGIPAKFICKLDEYKLKYNSLLNKTKPLILNGKRVYQLEKKITNEFIDKLDKIGFIE